MIGHGYLHVDLGCRNKWLSNWGISRALQSPIILSDQHTRGGSVISQRLWTLGSGFKFCPPNNLGSNLSLRDPNNFVTAAAAEGEGGIVIGHRHPIVGFQQPSVPGNPMIGTSNRRPLIKTGMRTNAGAARLDNY